MPANEQPSPPPAPAARFAPPHLSPAQLDAQFPGILDGVSLMAGGANVILQLAHPAVGHGVVESRVPSGQIFRRPFKRTRTTITYLAVALAGTEEERRLYREAVDRVHAQVYSTPQSPVAYKAFDPDLQLWVAACLCWGAVDTWRRLRGPAAAATAAAFHERAAAFGTTLQVRPGQWPRDRAAFDTYWQGGLARIHIDAPVRDYLTAVAELKFLPPWMSEVFGPLNRFVTAGFLPPPVREAMQFAWGEPQQKRFDRLVGAIAWVNRRLPRVVRQWPYLLALWDFRWRVRKGMPLL